MRRCGTAEIETAPLLYYGPPLPLEHIKRLSNRSMFRVKGSAEGLVLCREVGGGRLDIAKWVRPDHRPGVYLLGIDGAVTNTPVWHEPR